MPTRVAPRSAAKSHLTPDQVQLLRLRLVEEQAAQQVRAVELQDPPDLEPDLAQVLLIRCQETLDEIGEALQLIDRGHYGRCSGCDAAIPYERLEAVPAARHCVACHSARVRASR